MAAFDDADQPEPLMIAVVSWGANYSYGLTCVPAVVYDAHVSSIWLDVREFYPRDPDEGHGKGQGKKNRKGGGRVDSLTDKRLRDELLRGDWPAMLDAIAGRIEQELHGGCRQMLVMVNCSAGKHRAPFSAMLTHVWLSRKRMHSAPILSKTFHVTLGRSPIAELSKALDWLDDGESCSTRSGAMISDSGARREMADLTFFRSICAEPTEPDSTSQVADIENELTLCKTELASCRSEMKNLKSEVVLLSTEVSETKLELLAAQAEAAQYKLELDARNAAHEEVEGAEVKHEEEDDEDAIFERQEDGQQEQAEDGYDWGSHWPTKKRRWGSHPADESSACAPTAVSGATSSRSWRPPPPPARPVSRSLTKFVLVLRAVSLLHRPRTSHHTCAEH